MPATNSTISTGATDGLGSFRRACRRCVLLLAAVLAGCTPSTGVDEADFAPARITIASGDNQQTSPGTGLGQALVVQVWSKSGKKASRCTIDWEQRGSWTFTNQCDSTGSAGIIVENADVPRTRGSYMVTAKVREADASASFRYTVQ